MKQHYLNHNSHNSSVNPKDIVQIPDTTGDDVGDDIQDKMLLVQENCVSSSNQKTFVHTYPVEKQHPQRSGISSKYFDFYNTDIDDLSQYELNPSSIFAPMDTFNPSYNSLETNLTSSVHKFPSQSVSKSNHKLLKY